jgi:hypothetical protein
LSGRWRLISALEPYPETDQGWLAAIFGTHKENGRIGV